LIESTVECNRRAWSALTLGNNGNKARLQLTMASSASVDPATTTGIFVSYRRVDSRVYAGRLFDRLTHHFGPERVFMDVEDGIARGEDFPKEIEKAINTATAVVVVIGRQWLSCISLDGKPRLQHPDDWVRGEIRVALKRGVVLLPVLVDGASMPPPEEVPDDIRALTRRQASEISDTRWTYDVGEIIKVLEHVIPVQGRDRRWVRRATVAAIILAILVAVLLWKSVAVRQSPDPLLAEVQRSLHPLFPLSAEVAFRAPLTAEETRGFRTTLERLYQLEHPQNPDIPIVYFHPDDSIFPTCAKDSVAVQIVSANLSSEMRLYSRQRTKDGRFDQADVEFCPCPERQDSPPDRPSAIMVDDARRRKINKREYEFSLTHGLYMSDGGRKIEFAEAQSTTDMVSVDDLFGATLEVAIQPIDPSDDYCRPIISAQTEWVTLDSAAITLPGQRRVVIDRDKFTRIGPSKDGWIRYRFIIPQNKVEFENLINNRPH
jgi:hypothetical protein